MPKCPTVHELPEFKNSYDPKKREHQNEYNKILSYLKSECGHSFGEQLKYGLVPFKSFPGGHKSTRVLFLLCKDCNKEIFDEEKCPFCNEENHSMNDAVLVMIGDHPTTYEKEGVKVIDNYK